MSFGLYLHTPFCAVKCGYCDFYSVVPDPPDQAGRVGQVLLQAAARLLEQPPWRGRAIHSVYVGGGTPSLLPATFFRGLLGQGPVAERRLPGAEITVEMNPESVRRPWLDALARLGVGRASLGVQSFRPEALRLLDRLHTPGQAARARRAVGEAGIPSCGLDLIYQLPGQTAAGLDEELDRLLELEPDHVSAYGLGWEPGTRLEARRRAGELAPLEAERAAPLYLRLSRTLRRAGYQQYEVSNFARPGHAARHNSSYWWEGDVLAVGPSAVSAWTEGGRRHRRRFAADWRTFLAGCGEGGLPAWPEEALGEEEAWLEALYVGLRWRGGLDLERLAERFGAQRVAALRARAERLGLALVSARGRNRALATLFPRGAPGNPPPAAGELLRLRPGQWLLLDEWLLRLAG